MKDLELVLFFLMFNARVLSTTECFSFNMVNNDRRQDSILWIYNIGSPNLNYRETTFHMHEPNAWNNAQMNI